MLLVRTNGFEFRRFKSYQIESSLDTVADGFSFTIGNPRGDHAGEIVEGQVVTIFDDATQIMIGEIDTVIEGEEIEVQGRDLMVRAIENDVEHQEEVETVHPAKEIIRMAKEVGLTQIDQSGLPSGDAELEQLSSLRGNSAKAPSKISALKDFTREAGESTAEAMVRLADAGGFYIWLDRLGTLHLSLYDYDAAPGWDFFNRKEGSNCEPIKRRRSAANLKSEIWAFSDDLEPVKLGDQALIRLGIKRRKTLLDSESETPEEAQRKLQKIMNELKLRSREWQVTYGGPHARGREIPEVGKTATVSSYFSGVQNLKTLISSVTLTKDDQGTKTELVLRERP